MVGFLSSGESACDSLHLNLPDYYGKFSWAWSSDGSDSTKRLKDWLDPLGTNLMILDGRYTNSLDTIIKYVESIYPNPFEDELNISIKETGNSFVHVKVYDLPGRILYSSGYQVNNTGSFNIRLGFLPKGLYILRMESKDTTICRKIIRR